MSRGDFGSSLAALMTADEYKEILNYRNVFVFQQERGAKRAPEKKQEISGLESKGADAPWTVEDEFFDTVKKVCTSAKFVSTMTIECGCRYNCHTNDRCRKPGCDYVHMIARLLSGVIPNLNEEETTCICKLLAIRYQMLAKASGATGDNHGLHDLPEKLYCLMEKKVSRHQLAVYSRDLCRMLFPTAPDRDSASPVRERILTVLIEFFHYLSGKLEPNELVDLMLVDAALVKSPSERNIIRLAVAVQRRHIDQVELELAQILCTHFNVSPVVWDLLLMLVAADIPQALQSTFGLVALANNVLPPLVAPWLRGFVDFREAFTRFAESAPPFLPAALNPKQDAFGDLLKQLDRIQDKGAHEDEKRVGGKEAIQSLFAGNVASGADAVAAVLQISRGLAARFRESVSDLKTNPEALATNPTVLDDLKTLGVTGAAASHFIGLSVLGMRARKAVDTNDMQAKPVVVERIEQWLEAYLSVAPAAARLGDRRSALSKALLESLPYWSKLAEDAAPELRAIKVDDFAIEDAQMQLATEFSLPQSFVQAVWQILAGQPLSLKEALLSAAHLVGTEASPAVGLLLVVSHTSSNLKPFEIRNRTRALGLYVVLSAVVKQLGSKAVPRSDAVTTDGKALSIPFEQALVGFICLYEAANTSAKPRLVPRLAPSGRRGDYASFSRLLDSILALVPSHQPSRTVLVLTTISAGYKLFCRHLGHAPNLAKVATLFKQMCGIDLKTTTRVLQSLVKGDNKDYLALFEVLPILFDSILGPLDAVMEADEMIDEPVRGEEKKGAPVPRRNNVWHNLLGSLQVGGSDPKAIIKSIGDHVGVNFDRELWNDFCGAGVDLLGTDVGPSLERLQSIIPRLTDKAVLPQGGTLLARNHSLQNLTREKSTVAATAGPQFVESEKKDLETVLVMVAGVLHRDRDKLKRGVELMSRVFNLPSQIKALLDVTVTVLEEQAKAEEEAEQREADEGRAALKEDEEKAEKETEETKEEKKDKRDAEKDQKDEDDEDDSVDASPAAMSAAAKNVVKFCNAFSMDPVFVQGIIGVSKRDFEAIAKMTSRFGQAIDELKVQKFIVLLENLETLASAADAGGEGPAGGDGPASEEDVKKSMGEMTNSDLFHMFDEDGSGSMNFDEFVNLTKYLSLDLSEHAALQIFTKVAGPDNSIDKFEFDNAMKELEKQIAKRVVNDMGFGSSNLIKVFLGAVGLLLLIFIFIFLGIEALSFGSTFGSVVNSVMPLSAAGGVGASGDQTDKIKRLMESVEGKVKGVMEKLKAKH